MNNQNSPRTGSKPRKSGIIQDQKPRGEWAESLFLTRAQEHGLPVSKPWGEMRPYDFVVGSTGRFVSVQVKSTLNKLESGYVCKVLTGHQPYLSGSFDFLAAYVVPADAWYIIPAKLTQGKRCITLYPDSPNSKYEPYREAWRLLREAIAATEDPSQDAGDGEAPERLPSSVLERMEASFRFMKGRLEG